MIAFAMFLLLMTWAVAIYNLGYIVAAWMLGHKISDFSVGFGPMYAGATYGHTRFELRIIPLGGFVRCHNFSDVKWQSVFFFAAGPIAVFLMAIVVFTVMYVVGVPSAMPNHDAAVIGYVAAGSPAARAQLAAGDRITRIGDTPVRTWADVDGVELASVAGVPLHVVAERSGRPVQSTVVPVVDECRAAIFSGWSPQGTIQAADVTAKAAAAAAGLKAGDTIVAVNGKPVTAPLAVADAVRRNSGQAMTFTVQRDGRRIDLTITPKVTTSVGPPRYEIGADLRIATPVETTRLGFVEAARHAVRHSVKIAVLTIRFITDWALQRTAQDLRSSVVGKVMPPGQFNLMATTELTGMILVNLSLLNLLPLPMLVGGSIAMVVVQLVIRRRFSERLKEKLLMAGFVAIMALMVSIIYSDLSKAFPRWLGKEVVPKVDVACGTDAT